MNKYLRFISLIFVVVGTHSVASTANPLDVISIEGRVVYQTHIPAQEYRLSLANLKKINGQWVSDREEVIHSEVFRRTIELSSDYQVALETVIDDLEKQVKSEDSRALYSCDLMDCGSSNAWANNRFKVKQLYGMDASQYYRVWEVKHNKQFYVLVAYVVQRGNQRTYVQLDTLKPLDEAWEPLVASSEEIYRTLKDHGYWVFAHAEVASSGYKVSEAYAEHTVKALLKLFGKNVAVVGHDYSPVRLDNQIQSSESYAKIVAAALIKAGMPESRIEVRGVGGLAPQGKQGSAKVELVVIKK
ncbi:DUF4892 domain-containing protein [Teredinibacter sp. KSP-S5-2]|uniref:DUF4892 domain-containing protein n=1 Tax=Teredinibacter sp. KSP-S5-2 TaxID=3034506 RepID=UPI0029343BC1|nr:DUF4892 domain-containing protein [Teredinibacter sp. KSP-S5-2]WNO10961.1 DUF4892 domain-containing protein [Teredinibacter sp. KSP-S5-2]